MNILLPYDINTTGKSNPFLFLFLRAIENSGKLRRVQHGFGWLYEPGSWDVIHLHWPEVLAAALLTGPFSESAVEQEHIDEICNLLAGWKKKGCKIVLTVHNEKPHIDPSGRCADLYREVFSLTDGFIHMGAASETLIRQNFPEQAAGAFHFIIPHGNYSYFPDTLSREECRIKLGMKSHRKLILAFGAIRNQQELELGIKAFKQAEIPESVYMIAGKIPAPFMKQIRHYRVRRKLYANILNPSVRTVERIIPPDGVQLYLKAADLLLIPRFNTLNSGNVALGFTFGRVVAGPDYGVTGEVLRENGNPIFDPYRPETVSRAIRRGLDLAEGDLGEKNREYAKQQMNWEHVASLTVEAYRSVLE